MRALDAKRRFARKANTTVTLGTNDKRFFGRSRCGNGDHLIGIFAISPHYLGITIGLDLCKLRSRRYYNGLSLCDIRKEERQKEYRKLQA